MMFDCQLRHDPGVACSRGWPILLGEATTASPLRVMPKPRRSTTNKTRHQPAHVRMPACHPESWKTTDPELAQARDTLETASSCRTPPANCKPTQHSSRPSERRQTPCKPPLDQVQAVSTKSSEWSSSRFRPNAKLTDDEERAKDNRIGTCV
jgi:hypothetical protein